MSNEFLAFTHVERIGKDNVKGILDKPFIVQPKLDGCNASIWADDAGNLHYASRTREVSEDHDNAGFAYYIGHTSDSEVDALRKFCIAHPNLIVYGEFLGTPGRKLLGTIKQYLTSGFFVFDVYNREIKDYIPYKKWVNSIQRFYSKCVPGYEFDGGTSVEDVAAFAKTLSYNLPPDTMPEGVVIKGRDESYRSVYGDIHMAKIVLDEYFQLKKDNRANKGRKQPVSGSELEAAFIENYCTSAFLAKEQQKILVAFGEDEWKNDGKHIGMFVNKIVDELMEEEFWGFFRKNLCSVDLGRLKRMIQDKGRQFLGLM